jgi:CoA:oxalate CoA-transferase
MVTDWLSTMTREEAVAATRKFGVPAAPVRDLDEVINDAGMHERGMLHWVDHPEVGRVCLPSSPLRFTDAPAPAPALKPSPFLNQHEEEVLGGIFGFTAEQRAALREAGAISTAAQVKG